jgi:hypothetical protein
LYNDGSATAGHDRLTLRLAGEFGSLRPHVIDGHPHEGSRDFNLLVEIFGEAFGGDESLIEGWRDFAHLARTPLRHPSLAHRILESAPAIIAQMSPACG